MDVGHTVSVRLLRKVPENLATLPAMMAFGAFQDGSEDEIGERLPESFEIYFEDPREAEVGTKPMLGSPRKVPRDLDFFRSLTVIEKTSLIMNGR